MNKSSSSPLSQNPVTPPLSQEQIRKAIILVVLAYCLIYLLPLGMRPIMSPDETRYGEIPREMLQSGNWAVPHLIGVRYFEKPPMGYWLTAIAIKVFGENNFAVRLSSALASGLSAWLIWLLLVRSGYGRERALVAAMLFLSFTGVLIIGNLAILDSPFSLFLSGGMVLFYLAANDSAIAQRQRQYLLASGVLFGLAFLTKGLLAIVLPGIVLVPYCLLQKRYRLLWQCGWIALAGVVTILPWAIIIHLREADFWHYFFWEEHVRRFLAKNAQHSEPMYFYLLMLPVLAFPWSGFIPAAIVGLRQHSQQQDLLRYALLWFGMPLLFFSLSKGKLPTYILPCLAPAAILLSVGIMNYLEVGKKRLYMLAAGINTAVLLIGLVALWYQQYHAGASPLYQPDELIKLYALTAGLLLAIALSISTGMLRGASMNVSAIALSTLILIPVLGACLPSLSLNTLAPSRLFKQVAPQLKPDTVLVSDDNVVRAVAWVFKRSDIAMLSEGELFYGLKYPDDAHRHVGMEGLGKLLSEQRSGKLQQDIAVFCDEPCAAEIRVLVGPHAIHYTNEKFSVWQVRYGE